MKRCDDLMNQKQSIGAVLHKGTKKSNIEYQTRLIASIDIARLLLVLGLPFRGHDESESSLRKGNFLTFYEWYVARCPDVAAVALKNAPQNLKLVSSTIQKHIVKACAIETVKAIIEDLGDEYFAILVDESRDVSHKEQMALAIRYVDKRGFSVERVIGLSHVTQTTSLALQQAIYAVLKKHNLSPSRIRGQGYDGASNMQGHLNGLKTLVMEDSRSAHSIHCFAHQLQLTLVAVAKNHEDVVWLFEWMSVLLSTVGNSFKNRDMLREKQAKRVHAALQNGELETGRGLNQELGLKRAGDTRWGSHFSSLLNMIVMFPSVIEVVDDNAQNASKALDRIKAKGVLDAIQTFDFVFMMHLMKAILGITNDLSVALQRKDQDIVNAVSYLHTTKRRLQEMRNQSWEGMIKKVTDFCIEQDIELSDMDVMHIPRGSKSKRKVQTDGISNKNYYQSVMYAIIDMLRVEIDDRFSENSTTLLLGMASLDPSDLFANFDKEKVLAMARLYPDDFGSESKIEDLSVQLDNFLENVRDDSRISNLKGVSDLCRKLVETKKYNTFPLVFLLVKLALILPVATATVERAFSAMKYIKSDLRNRIGDDFFLTSHGFDPGTATAGAWGAV
ncbi:zinc finger MYM-type protein 1-like [Triticum aestivum]|uniref:zinc finger MYM-type protein 1-like n=1 Tax=Triticum aestivum TaxID=4565 RepID=UPI001D0288E3|nr:zinc finger MYM-type protein 1-like [Triticum aestivum]